MTATALDFKTRLESISAWAHKHGISHSYNGGIGCFEQMPSEHQVLAMTGLCKHMDFLMDADPEVEMDYGNTSQLLKAALKKLGWKLKEGLLDSVLPTDYVEIYTRDLVPAFKSLNFWGHCSYTLDDLYSYPYSELFAREEFFQASINRAAQKIFSGASEIIERPVPEHIAWETRGPLKRKIEYKFFAAVYDSDGDMAGGIVVSDITPLLS